MLVRQVSRAFGTSFLRKVLLVRSGVAVVRNRRILPCGSRAFSRAPYLIFTPRWFGDLTVVCKLPLILWLIRASGHRNARQISRSFGTFFLRRSPFCSLGLGGCSQPSFSSLRIPNVFERSLLYFYSRRGRWLPMVCKLPLNLWLFSASGRLCPRQISRSSERSFCKEVLFVHRVWRLFAIVSFILADSRTLSRALLDCGLQATPESLASQCLLAAYLLRQGLTPVFLRPFVVSLVGFTSPQQSRFLNRMSQLFFLTCGQRHGNLRSGYNPCLSGLTAPPGCCAGTPMDGCFRWSNRPGDSSLGSVANLFPRGNLSPIGLFLNGFGPETPGLLWSAVYP
jgi:hypothetical protein